MEVGYSSRIDPWKRSPRPCSHCWVDSKGEETEIKRPVLRLYPVEVSNEQHDGGHKEVAGSAQSAVRFVPDDQVEIV